MTEDNDTPRAPVWLFLTVLGACAWLLLFMLTGCASAPQVVEVKTPVPVECREEVPDRPVMPTEEFKAKPDLDQFAQAAMAEIERREGYEVRLRTALEACTAPINP